MDQICYLGIHCAHEISILIYKNRWSLLTPKKQERVVSLKITCEFPYVNEGLGRMKCGQNLD